MKKVLYTTLTTVVAAVVLAFGSGTAAAATLYIEEVQYGVEQPNAIAQCRPGPGGTCTISKGKQVSSSISGNLGVTVGALNASMGASYQETYTTTVGCTSPPLGPGDVYVAFPRGDFVFFNVDGAPGTAFLPTGVNCEVRSDW